MGYRSTTLLLQKGMRWSGESDVSKVLFPGIEKVTNQLEECPCMAK